MTRQPKQSRLILLGVILAMGITIIWQSSKIKEFKSAAANARLESRQDVAMSNLLWNLSVPDEAILCDGNAIAQIADIRKRCWREESFQAFLPAYSIIGGGQGNWGINSPSAWHAISVDRADKAPWELFQVQRVPEVCADLAGQMKDNRGLGKYLKDHKDLFESEVRPRLLRLLGARSNGAIPLAACQVLLAAGERSDLVRGELSRLAAAGDRPDFAQAAEAAQKLLAEYGWKATAASSSLPAGVTTSASAEHGPASPPKSLP